MPIKKYVISVCSQFWVITYRRRGSRGPAPRLLYAPAKVDPAAWLAERLGAVVIMDEPQPAADAPPAEDQAAEPENPGKSPIRDCDGFPAAAPLAAGCPSDGIDWELALRSLALGSFPGGGLIPHTVGPASDALICIGIGDDAEDTAPPFNPPPPSPSGRRAQAG